MVMSIKDAMKALKSARAHAAETMAAYKVNPTADNEVAMLDARAIVVLIIAIYLLSALLPSAITALNASNTTGWTATQLAIWGVVSIVILATIIIKITE